MEIDPGAYIAELLYEHDTVSLPGFGSFVKAYKDASIDYVQGEIKPPGSALNFNRNLVMDDGLLMKMLKKKHGLPVSRAEKVVEKYVAELKNRLEKKEFLTFQGLGRLYKDFEGNFKFLPEHHNFNADTFGLPDLHFYPVSRPFTESVNTKSSHTPSTKSEKVTNTIADWFTKNLLWVSAAAFIVVISAIYLAVFKNNAQSKTNGEPPANERVNVSPSDNQSDYEVVDDNMDDEGAPVTEDQQPASADAQTENSEAPTLSPNEKVAVIIIGKFGNQSNVDKLVKRIFEAGYEPYTDKEGKLTVVGVQMVYDSESEVQSTLKKIRKKFEPGAKILKME